MSTDEPRHRQYGIPLGEWIAGYVNDLDFDLVGFWQIAPCGREYFGLSGPDYDDFVRRSLLALFERGAVPVRHVPESGHVWTWQSSYGTFPEEMTEAIVKEWIEKGRPDPDLGDLWFALKRDLGLPYVKKL